MLSTHMCKLRQLYLQRQKIEWWLPETGMCGGGGAPEGGGLRTQNFS